MEKNLKILLLVVLVALVITALAGYYSSYLGGRAPIFDDPVLIGGKLPLSNVVTEPGKHFVTFVYKKRDGSDAKRFTSIFTVIDSDKSLACLADINKDGFVDNLDKNIVLSQLEQTGVGLSGDIDGDGEVDLNDLQITVDQYNKECLDEPRYCAADLNKDGVTDYKDYTVLRSEFFKFEDGLVSDFNEDGQVDFVDVNNFRHAWLECAGDAPPFCEADLNLDGFTNYSDVTLFDSVLGTLGDGIVGDFDGDGAVNFRDLVNFRNSYFECTGYAPLSACDGDLDKDGTVDGVDLTIIENSAGLTGSDLAADLNRDGKVDIADIQLLRTFLITEDCPV